MFTLRTSTLGLAFTLLTAACLPGQKEEQEGRDQSPAKAEGAAAQVLETFRKARYNPREKGLHSFILRLTLHDSPGGRLEALYSWKKPETEEVLPTNRDGRRRGQSRLMTKALTGLFQDLVGTDPTADSRFNGCTLEQVEEGKEGPLLLGARRGKREVARFTFDRKTGLLTGIEQGGKAKGQIGFSWTRQEGTNLPAGRQVEGGKGSRSFAYASYRRFNGFFLPGLITVSMARGEMKLQVQVEQINGRPAKAANLDPRLVAEAIKAFKAGWSRLDPLERKARVEKLADLGGPRAAETLGGKLADRSSLVRLAIIEALGRMREKKVTPLLCRLLGKAEDEMETFKALCRALGDIGDPRAVEPLARGIFSGDRRSKEYQTGARERIDAMGAIRHPKSVDELVSLLGKTGRGGRRIGVGRGGGGGNNRLQRLINSALTRLTGQELTSHTDWRKWWKANRNHFKY